MKKVINISLAEKDPVLQKKTITKLQNDEGTLIDESKAILNEIRSYYETLYSSSYQPENNLQCREYIEQTDGLNTLTEEQKAICEGDLTIEECYNCLKLFKNNKSPGCDGLSIEFYRKFWNKIGSKLVDTINYGKREGQLSLSQRRGIITLIHKKGKPEDKLKNWRPISLLNIDYKIMTKTLAKRLEKVVSHLVHPNQSGFIKGRFIGEGIRFVEDIIEYMDYNKEPGLLLQLDFEKAFDSVEWPFLLHVLKQFGFGDDFIEWVKVCYTDIFASVGNSGFYTLWFEIKRGVRQGCPLSCLLFILIAEILAQRIRNENKIRGIVIDNIEHKILQFADDTTCVLKDEDSVGELFHTIDKFTQYSGLKLNIDKTSLIWLGPWRKKTDGIDNLKVEQGCFNILGIFVGRDKKSKDKYNFHDKIMNMRKSFNIWSGRNLTLFGRILVSKTHGLSNLIYSLTMTESNIATCQSAQKEVTQYIWGYKPPKVKHSTLIGKIEQGGAKAIDVEIMRKALGIAWISRLWTIEPWNSVIREQLKPYGGFRFLLRCNYDYKQIQIPEFYNNILEYCRCVFSKESSKHILWNNKDILIGGSHVYYKDWFFKGIIYIQDLYKINGQLLNYEEFKQK